MENEEKVSRPYLEEMIRCPGALKAGVHTAKYALQCEKEVEKLKKTIDQLLKGARQAVPLLYNMNEGVKSKSGRDDTMALEAAGNLDMGIHLSHKAVASHDSECPHCYNSPCEAWCRTNADPKYKLTKSLEEAALDLYKAGYWTCDRPVDEEKLWEALRDALGLNHENSLKPNKCSNLKDTNK